MRQRTARMTELVWHTMSKKEKEGAPHAKKKDVGLRVKSYLLQEAEAVSRAAKMEWCAQHGVRVVSIQHDGVVVASIPHGWSAKEMAEQLGMAASGACGYEVVVEGKWIGAVVAD